MKLTFYEGTVCLDVTIESSEAHLELCRALSVVNKPKALLKVAVSQLDISAAGVAMVVVLLELIDPKVMDKWKMLFILLF